MKTRLLIILAFCFVSTYSLAQVDPFAALDSTFNAYIGTMDEDYNRKIKEMDEDFYKYLSTSWEAFQLYEAIEKPEYGSADLSTISYSNTRSNPVYPRKKNATYHTKAFPFFEEAISVKADSKTHLRLASISEKDVAEGWKHLTNTDFYVTLKDSYDIKSRLKLNDWGVFLLFARLSDKVFTSAQHNERILFTAFMLTHAGYDIKLARSGEISDKKSRLIMLLPFQSEVYQKVRTKINDKFYYIETLSDDVKINDLDLYKVKKVYSYRKNFELATSPVDLSLPIVPILGSSFIRKEMKSSTGEKVRVVWRQGLTDFYNTYPETELPIYFNTPMSKELRNSLEPIITPLTDNKDKIKTVERLLAWFYHSFPYKLDKKQQTLFPEQTVLYPYSDCEDRSILFAHIVKEFAGLDVVLLQFDGHIATGIHFNQQTNGFSHTHKNRKYVACDPSSKQCKTGYITENHEKDNITVIELIK